MNGRLMVQNVHISYSNFNGVNGTIHLPLVIMQMSVQKIIIRLNGISLVDEWCPMVRCEHNGIRMVFKWCL